MSQPIFVAENNPRSTPKYIILLSMMYVITFIFPLMMAYRMVHLGPFLLPGGTLFFPISYFLGDIIAEVYGYQLARQLVWSAIICQLLTSLFIMFVLKLPYPENWHAEASFDLVLGHSLRYAVASTIGNFFGEFFNIYIITKAKILMRGKYFWLRSLGSTCIGETALTIIVFFITFVGITDFHSLIELMVSGYVFKILYSFIGVIPTSYLVNYLKKSEDLDVYDYKTNFNPFKFKINQEELSKFEEAKC